MIGCCKIDKTASYLIVIGSSKGLQPLVNDWLARNEFVPQGVLGMLFDLQLVGFFGASLPHTRCRVPFYPL